MNCTRKKIKAKIRSPGNFMKCLGRENQAKCQKLKPGGGGSFRGSKNQKSGKFHELLRKLIHFSNPPPRMERGRGGREGGDREGEREREAGKEGGARAKPGNHAASFI